MKTTEELAKELHEEVYGYCPAGRPPRQWLVIAKKVQEFISEAERKARVEELKYIVSRGETYIYIPEIEKRIAELEGSGK